MEELASNNVVDLCFAANSRYLSVMGDAIFSSDMNKINELWDSSLDSWFHEGKQTRGLVAINVVPQAGDYWDYSGIGQVIIPLSNCIM